MAARPRSLIRRTLLQVACGVTCIILVASITTYYVLFDQLRQRTLAELLHTFIARSNAQGAQFRLALDLQHVIRDDVVRQYPAYQNSRSQRRFDRLFVRDAQGAIRSRDRKPEPHLVSAWLRRGVPLTPELRARMVLFHDICEQYKATVHLRFLDIFFASREQLNIGTDAPGKLPWGWEVPADYDQDAQDWNHIADPDQDPSHETVWMAVAYDSVWKMTISSIATPIYVGGRYIGAVYNDLWVEQMIPDLLQPGVPGAQHAVFTTEGILIAFTGRMAQIHATQGGYRINARTDPVLGTMLRAARAHPGQSLSGYDAATDQYYALGRFEGPGWWYASMLPGAVVRSEAFRTAQWVLWSGLGSLALLLAVFWVILRREIARPLGELTQAVGHIEQGAEPPVLRQLEGGRMDELGRLAAAFAGLSQRIVERDAALRAEKQELQKALSDLRETEERSRAMTAALHHSEKLASMGSLLAGVAHELNNPLSVVIGRAMMLETAARDTATQVGVRKLRTAAERCERIVKTYLAMARSRQPLRQGSSIHEIIEVALEVLDYTLQTHCVQVRYERAAFVPELQLDPDQMHQVFINLFVNAQQAMSEGPGERILSIATCYLEAEGVVEVRVADTGPGIAPEIRSRIFDPYFTTKPTGVGTGVGLSVSLGIVQAHGGTLCAGCPERGALFTVRLPTGAASHPGGEDRP